jgi:hypothetical protein
MQSSMMRVASPIRILAVFLSFPAAACVAQSAPASTDAAAGAQASAQAAAIAARYMTSVDTELTAKLDSKYAAVGQQITAKTKATAKLADGTTLPKGTRLAGHVTQVQAHTRDQPYSTLAVNFDRAELKNGQTVSLRCVIRTVAPPAAVNNLSVDEPAGATSPASAMGAGSARSGMTLGGGGVVRAAGQTAGGVGQAAGSTVGSATAGARPLAETAASTTGGMVAQAGESVSAAPRATGLPGVMLSTSASGDVSGTLAASGRNISLDAGTQITLGIVAR